MPLHPQIELVLKAMEEAKMRPVETLTPQEARLQIEAMARARNAHPTPVGKIEERRIPGPAADIRVRMYWPPSASGPVPAILYFHGGGHVIGSLDTHDAVARNLCAGAGALVVSVDYRMGPEHRFPAAVDDSFASLLWLRAQATNLGADPYRLAVAGDSAGANLAAVVALMARDAGGPRLSLQSLIYPIADYNLVGESYGRYAAGYGVLTRRAMEWFRQHYLAEPGQADDWRASPIKAKSLAGAAPAVVVTAEYDVLRDDGARYAAALAAAGVPVEHKEYPGMIHGFFSMVPGVDAALEAQRHAIAALSRAFAA